MDNGRTSGTRIWELDFFRGIALLLMVYFHLVYDLSDIFNQPVTYSTGINFYIGKVSVMMFMVISAISCQLSRNNFKRGLRLFLLALAVTIATHLWNADYEIRFGILHFLGICLMLYPLLDRLNIPLLSLGALASIVTGNELSSMSTGYQFLFPLGLRAPGFISADYYPLLPWIGVFLIGMIMGRIFYNQKKSKVPPLFKHADPISYAGSHTLIIYLIHQPLLIGLLSLFLKTS